MTSNILSAFQGFFYFCTTMIKRVSVLFLIFYFVSCRGKVPEHIIPEDQFATLLTDIYYLNSTLEILPVQYKDSIIHLERSKILAKHGIQDSTFVISMKFYNAHPQIMENIESVIRKEFIQRISKDSIEAGPQEKDTIPKLNE